MISSYPQCNRVYLTLSSDINSAASDFTGNSSLSSWLVHTDYRTSLFIIFNEGIIMPPYVSVPLFRDCRQFLQHRDQTLTPPLTERHNKWWERSAADASPARKLQRGEIWQMQNEHGAYYFLFFFFLILLIYLSSKADIWRRGSGGTRSTRWAFLLHSIVISLSFFSTSVLDGEDCLR